MGGKGSGQDSVNARAVARRVIEKIQKGEKVLLAPLIRAQGYAETVAKSPHMVTKTHAYQDEINTYTQRLEKERTRVLRAMEKKDLDDEQYRTLVDAETKLTHDVQLLTGGKTENVQVTEDHNVLVAILAEVRAAPLPALEDTRSFVLRKLDDKRRETEGEGAPEAI